MAKEVAWNFILPKYTLKNARQKYSVLQYSPMSLGRIRFSKTGFRLNPKPVLVSE